MFNFRRFLMRYFMAASYVVADEGAGGDFMIDEPEASPDVLKETELKTEPEASPDASKETELKTEPEASPDAQESKELQAIMAELEELKAFRDEQTKFMTEAQNQALVKEASAELKAKYEDFDIDNIKAHLQELHTDDPDKAEMLNNPVGWELIHMQMSAERNDGVFMAPRGVSKEPFDLAKASAKAANGDEAAQIALLYGN